MKVTATGMTRLKAAALAVVLAIGVAACGGGDDDSDSATGGAGDLDTVRISQLATTAFAPLEAGVELGIFEKHGINIEFVPVQSGTALLTAVDTDVADWSFSVSLSAIASAISQDRNVELAGNSIPTGPGFWLLAKKGSGITSLEDLNGKQIGASEAGSVTDVYAQYTIGTENLDAEVIYAGYPALMPGVLSGKLDAVVASGPQTYIQNEKGDIEIIVDYAEAALMDSFWVSQKGWAEDPEKREIGSRMMDAWVETIEYLKANKDWTVDYLAKSQEVSDSVAESMYEMVELAGTDAAVHEEDVEAAYDIFSKGGIDISEFPPASELATSVYVE